MSDYRLISESYQKARKQHKCIWCGEKIVIGEKYRREASFYDEFQTHNWHMECNAAAQIEFGHGEVEFSPHENPRGGHSDDSPMHCWSCQDTQIGTNGPDSRCNECRPRRRVRDDP